MEQTNGIIKPVRRWRKRVSKEKLSLRPSARGDSKKVSAAGSQKKLDADNRSEKSIPESLLDEEEYLLKIKKLIFYLRLIRVT